MTTEVTIILFLNGNRITSVYPTRLEQMVKTKSEKEESWMRRVACKSEENRENNTFSNEYILRYNQ